MTMKRTSRSTAKAAADDKKPPATTRTGVGADRLNSQFLQTLVGYNTRRAWSKISIVFAECMAPYGLKPVDFSVLSLLAHNPGATSRQLCATLDVLPPNLVNLISTLDSRGLIERRPHPRDGRAVGLYLTPAGEKLTADAERAVTQAELDASAQLSARERESLIHLLKKLYL